MNENGFNEYEIEKYKEIEEKYYRSKERFFWFGNRFKFGLLLFCTIFTALEIRILTRYMMGFSDILEVVNYIAEVVFLFTYWFAITRTRLTRIGAYYEPGSGQPYKGLLFVFSAFACGVILCYLI